MQNLGGVGGGANKVHYYWRCASSEINRHSFSPPDPLVLIDHVTKRNDGLACILFLVRGKLRCVNFMRCPKGLRSMGSNNNLLNEYFRAKYIDTQKCLFHISFAFFCRLQESYALSSLFFFYIYFWENTFKDEPRIFLFLFWRKFQETMRQSENGIPEILMKFSGSSRERTHSGHEKVSVTRAGSLRECKNTEFVWELRKTGFWKGQCRSCSEGLS